MLSVRSLSLVALIAAVAASGPAQAASINIGGNGGLLGGNNGGSGGLLGTGLLGGGSGNTGGNGNASVNVNLGGQGLLGSGGSGDSTASVNLGGLFGGSSGDTSADVTLGGDGSSTNGNVLVDLFGNGGDTGDAGLSLGLGAGQGGANPTGNVTLDLFGDGSDTGSGTGGGDTGGFTPGPTTEGLFGPGATSVVNTASLNASVTKACFTPNPRQVMQLVNRHPYVPDTFQSWSGATTIKVIDANVCDPAAARIDAQANIGRLQQYITSDDQLRTQLAQWGHAPADVIAVDRQGKTLLVYVS